MGGARPTVLLEDGGVQLIAKLSSSTDPYPVVKAQALGFELARRVGINPELVADHLARRGVLLVERFDRTADGARRSMVSGLTMLGLHEMVSRYATYPDLLDVLRREGSDAEVGLAARNVSIATAATRSPGSPRPQDRPGVPPDAHP